VTAYGKTRPVARQNFEKKGKSKKKMSINVNVFFGISWISNFYRPSSMLRWKFGHFDELFKHFHADPG
jgi:hypothetical protein